LKVNLILLTLAAVVVEMFAMLSTPFLEDIARAEVLQKARIMMEAAAGIRTYTSNEIAPLLNAKGDGGKFHPQTVPAYAASKNFALLANKFTDYAYREAALNPVNLSNRARDWEADIIDDFRRHPHKGESITERQTSNGRILHLSHPIVSRGPCLSCHGAVADAPKSMLATYGTQTGFGWKRDEVVGAQIVSVPMAVALKQSARTRNLFMGVLAGVFLLLIGLFNLLPVLMTKLPRADERPGGAVHPRVAAARSVRAFGYGLSAAGVVFVVAGYVVIYARDGIGALVGALDPFTPMNYVKIAAIVPGVLTILVAGYLNARARTSAAS
jgi:protein-histidine pros-kinase